MIAFDLVLGQPRFRARPTLRVLGHEAPSPDAEHLFRRCGPIWLTFAAAHTPPRRAEPSAGLVGAGLAAGDRDRHRRAVVGSAAFSAAREPGWGFAPQASSTSAGARFAGLASRNGAAR